MSIVRCDRCSGHIDTDHDTECEVYTGNYKRLHATTILCEACRYELEADQDYHDALAAKAEYEAERNHDAARS